MNHQYDQHDNRFAHRDEDPWYDPGELHDTNAKHDAELRAMHISREGRIKSAWNPSRLALRGMLTDKKIRAYTKLGYYSAEHKEARRKAMAKNGYRKSNFTERDGRLIYTP